MKYLGRVGLAVLVAGSLACSREQSASSDHSQTSFLSDALRVRADTAMVLRVYSVKDSIRPSDSIKVVTLLWNPGNARRLRNDPELLHFDVVAPSGSHISMGNSQPQEWNLGERPNLELPHGGILGQVTNLSCRAQPFAPMSAYYSCMESLKLQDPGTYKIVARFDEIRVDTGDQENTGGLHLISDTLRVVFQNH